MLQSTEKILVPCFSLTYTCEQLLTLFSSPKSGWFMLRNDVTPNPSADVSHIEPNSGAVESNGVWKIHISIQPSDMRAAIPILHRQFFQDKSLIMGMKIASSGLLAASHQSGKQVALIFDRETETSKLGQQKILRFLTQLALAFEQAGILPEDKPPLTVETEDLVRRSGTAEDQHNLERRKYDASIKFRAGERLSYFNYRDEQVVLCDDADFADFYNLAPVDTRQQIVNARIFDQWNRFHHPEFKHNPSQRRDDFLYGKVLEQVFDLSRITRLQIHASDKTSFLIELATKLNKDSCSRSDILDLFAEIKKKNGLYYYIHQQRHPQFDRFRLLFKSSVTNQNEDNFWHTATYQHAVKLLKQAYIAKGPSDQSDSLRAPEANALIDYVRGNSPFHFTRTTTRAGLK